MRFFLLLIAILVCAGPRAFGQQPPQPGAPITLQNAPQRDTTNRSNKGDWHNEPVTIYGHGAFSGVKHYLPDSAIHHFHRRLFLQPYYRDLGNLGTPMRSQLFLPENMGYTGPSLGYHVYDGYCLKADSLKYYNTTRPYTLFSYQLGSKLEQVARLMHTQNITPRWNVAAQYQKISSQGFYRLQRANQDAGSLSTHFSSRNQRYELYGALVYNKVSTDENGGITNEKQLDLADYNDRQTLPVNLENTKYNVGTSLGRRSSYTNYFRDFNVLLQHRYTLGRHDTLYNQDSTQYQIKLIPRFSVGHRFEAGSQKHRFKSLAPDSAVWASFFNRGLATGDSVFGEQYWSWVDNRAVLSGFVGKGDRQISASAGIGNRVDVFYTDVIQSRDRNSVLSTYVTADVSKEALAERAWGLEANAKLFLTGTAAGNLLLQGKLSKDFGPKLGSLSIGAMQQLTDAPYAYTLYANQYFRQDASLTKESITSFFGQLSSARYGITAGVRSYLIGNYIYLRDSLNRVVNARLELSQYDAAFSVNQITFRKWQRIGRFVIDADAAIQGVTGNAPLNLPLVTGRASASYESPLFSRALFIATGIDLRYHTPYKAEGYSPFYNRFYYQDAYTADNYPEMALYFNFRIKRFRAYLMGDQLQTLWWRNTIVHPGYPSQNPMIRFGFDWVMVN